MHVFLEGVMREVNFDLNGLVDEISHSFGCGAEVLQDFTPTHLQC